MTSPEQSKPRPGDDIAQWYGTPSWLRAAAIAPAAPAGRALGTGKLPVGYDGALGALGALAAPPLAVVVLRDVVVVEPAGAAARTVAAWAAALAADCAAAWA